MTLAELCRLHNTDKDLPAGHSYARTYEDYLFDRKLTVTAVLELGVLGGASLRVWRDYFQNAEIIGLDHVTVPRTEDRIRIMEADVTKEDQLNAALGDRTFDVVVDDASHWEDDQIKSFELLKPRLRPGGIWFIEDVQWNTTHDKLRALSFEIHDLRGERPGRFDNVLAVFEQR